MNFECIVIYFVDFFFECNVLLCFKVSKQILRSKGIDISYTHLTDNS